MSARLLIVVAVALIASASCSRGDARTGPNSPAGNPVPAPLALTGRSLYLRNCAHCHADDATGDEGPDLHGLSRTDSWLANRIRNGKKGQMPAFGEKFKQPDVDALIAYLHTLK